MPTKAANPVIAGTPSVMTPSQPEARAEPSPERQPERRNAQRYPCRVRATLHAGHDRPGVEVALSDISWTGCYVETPSVLGAGFEVLLKFQLAGIALAEHGTVRTSHPMVGMGILFDQPSPDLRAAVSLLGDDGMQRLAEAPPPPDSRESSSPPVPLMIMLTSGQAQELARAVVRWFEQHETLPRDEFVFLLQQLVLNATNPK
jgi:hypothetical protein